MNYTKMKEQVKDNLLSSYYKDLLYIRNFQRFKNNKISSTNYSTNDTGSFHSFLIDYRVIRNIKKDSSKELLDNIHDWINVNQPDNVDQFAEYLRDTNLTRGNIAVSLASKILFLNNPWLIIPMDGLARKALKQTENKYSIYKLNLESYCTENKLEIEDIIQETNHLTSIIDDEFENELKDLKTICKNRVVDTLLWTLGRLAL